MDTLGIGAFHGCEIVYVFGNLKPATGYTAVDEAISADMRGYWTRFAAWGNPNGGAFAWPAYDEASDQHLVIDETLSVGANLREPYCDYLDSLLP
jgi:para-nitrobenzyl esterase